MLKNPLAPQSFPQEKQMKYQSRKSKPLRDKSRGAVIIEMAVCLPLMLMVVFGCLEVSSGIFRGQTLTSAAHEGALVGVKQSSTAQDVMDRVDVVLEARGISEYDFNLETFGTPFEDLSPGDAFRIELSTVINNSYLTVRSIDAAVTALRP